MTGTSDKPDRHETGSKRPDTEIAHSTPHNERGDQKPPKKNQSNLARYRDREELTWATELKQLQNLAWQLRMQHAEAEHRSRNSAIAAGAITTLAILVVGIGVTAGLCGWVRLTRHIMSNKGELIIPPHLWEVILATSAMALLIAGFATLLFNVARGYHERYSNHVREMEATRRVEAAVRLTMSTTVIESDEIKIAFSQLAEKLVTFPNEKIVTESTGDLSAMPEIVKAVKELIEAVAKVGKSGKD